MKGPIYKIIPKTHEALVREGASEADANREEGTGEDYLGACQLPQRPAPQSCPA